MTHTIPRRVLERVQAGPDRLAVHFRELRPDGVHEQRISYGELWESASAFSAALKTLPAASHVMIVMPLGIRLLAAHLGIQLHGCAASIFTHPSEKMNADVYGRNLRHAVTTLCPDAVIVARDYLTHLRAADSEGVLPTLVAEEVPDRSGAEPTMWPQIASGATAIIQYSSGSTGLQKSVALSHEMVIGQCDSYGRFIGLDHDRDVICSWLPLYHDMGLFTSWLLPLMQGVPVSMIDPFGWVKQPRSILELITDVQGTLCWQPNFAFRLLASRLAADELKGLDLSTMRGFTNCSEPVSAQTMRDFHSAFRRVGVSEPALWTCYAMAENAFAVTASGGPTENVRLIRVNPEAYARGEARLAASDGLDLVSCGIPIPGCEVRVVDAQRSDLQPGEIGEIALRSPYMLREYVRSPGLTSQAIDAEKWFYSGDLGFLLGGRLFVTGRKKDLLIVGGRNFYPQDIEEICGRCAGAIPGRAVALGTEDAALGTQKIIVLVESRAKTADERAKLAATVRQQVFEELDCPVADVRIVPHMWLLKTSSGKIARKPNLEKFQRELEHVRSVGVIRRASVFETAVWSLIIATCFYVYALIFLLGDSKSWNVYAGF